MVQRNATSTGAALTVTLAPHTATRPAQLTRSATAELARTVAMGTGGLIAPVSTTIYATPQVVTVWLVQI